MNNVVVLDANVLFPPSLRDLLMYLAVGGIIEARWSDQIHEEWIRGVLRNRSHLTREKLERARNAMNARFPDSLLAGYESLIEALQLPDPNDRHVLALAIHAKASLIVTFNLNDFPSSALSRYGIEAVTPDELIGRLAISNPIGVLEAAQRHRISLHRPPKTPEEYLATLENQRLPKTVAFLREHRDRI